MLDLVGSVVGLATFGVILAALSATLDLDRSSRLWIGAIAGAWVGLLRDWAPKEILGSRRIARLR